ncbi:hypothetical protein Tco_0253120 [Tanacetum coccineum]
MTTSTLPSLIGWSNRTVDLNVSVAILLPVAGPLFLQFSWSVAPLLLVLHFNSARSVMMQSAFSYTGDAVVGVDVTVVVVVESSSVVKLSFSLRFRGGNIPSYFEQSPMKNFFISHKKPDTIVEHKGANSWNPLTYALRSFLQPVSLSITQQYLSSLDSVRGLVLLYQKLLEFNPGPYQLVHVKFEISIWHGARVDVRTYLLRGAIDSSEANGIIRDPKLEIESSHTSTFDVSHLP